MIGKRDKCERAALRVAAHAGMTPNAVSDAHMSALAEHYSQEQMMDLVFTVGQYNLVSWALNSFGVQYDKRDES